MKRFYNTFIAGFIFGLSILEASAQQKVCNEKSPLYFMFEQVEVQEPEDAALREQYAKIATLKSKTLELVQVNPSFSVIPIRTISAVSISGNSSSKIRICLAN